MESWFMLLLCPLTHYAHQDILEGDLTLINSLIYHQMRDCNTVLPCLTCRFDLETTGFFSQWPMMHNCNLKWWRFPFWPILVEVHAPVRVWLVTELLLNVIDSTGQKLATVEFGHWYEYLTFDWCTILVFDRSLPIECKCRQELKAVHLSELLWSDHGLIYVASGSWNCSLWQWCRAMDCSSETVM